MMVGAKSDAGDGRDLLLLKQLIAKRQRTKPGFLDVAKKVKSALGLERNKLGAFAHFSKNKIASLLKEDPHFFDFILVFQTECCLRSRLGKRGGI